MTSLKVFLTVVGVLMLGLAPQLSHGLQLTAASPRTIALYEATAKQFEDELDKAKKELQTAKLELDKATNKAVIQAKATEVTRLEKQIKDAYTGLKDAYARLAKEGVAVKRRDSEKRTTRPGEREFQFKPLPQLDNDFAAGLYWHHNNPTHDPFLDQVLRSWWTYLHDVLRKRSKIDVPAYRDWYSDRRIKREKEAYVSYPSKRLEDDLMTWLEEERHNWIDTYMGEKIKVNGKVYTGEDYIKKRGSTPRLLNRQRDYTSLNRLVQYLGKLEDERQGLAWQKAGYKTDY